MHTILGGAKHEARGIIPHAVEKIVTHVETEKLWSFTVKASFVEILNDTIKDLLSSVNMKGSGKTPNCITLKPLMIINDGHGKIYVSGATEITIDTNNSANGLMQLEEIIAAA
jgi:hypothetical protein